jgi:glycine/D-amino acid oxidase-like deaminating enzyme
MLSYWEKQSFLQYDFIVIGAGITGLSTAISLREKFPTKRMLILERGLFPSGASTRNAGFACIGSLTELLDYLNTMTDQQVYELVAMRKAGLELLRKRLGDGAIDYQENGSYELINERELSQLNYIDQLNQLLYPLLKGPAYELANDKIDTFGFGTRYTKALIRNCYEGELNTGKMMRALTDKAIHHSVEIKTGAYVEKWQENNGRVEVVLKDSLSADEILLKAEKLFICNNAFAKSILPELQLLPGRGQIILTAPLNQLPFKGVYHFDKGYYYFRELHGRILFGGGRQLDFEGETTESFGLTGKIQADLEEKLQSVILPGRSVAIEQRWSGIMAFGPARHPVVQSYSPGVFVGVRLGGMGVAIGSIIGEQLAQMAVNSR